MLCFNKSTGEYNTKKILFVLCGSVALTINGTAKIISKFMN